MMVSSAPDTKRCGVCGAVKPRTEFYRDGSKNGVRYCCKICTREQMAKRYRTGGRDAHLRRTFGITADVFDAMLALQGGCCAVCGVEQTTDGRAFRVDHDHVTGRVRGLLCHSCNVALGLLKDDVVVLAQAIAYLERSRQSARSDIFTDDGVVAA